MLWSSVIVAMRHHRRLPGYDLGFPMFTFQQLGVPLQGTWELGAIQGFMRFRCEGFQKIRGRSLGRARKIQF